MKYHIRISWRNIYTAIRLSRNVSQQTFVLMKTSSRRLQDVLIKTNMFALALLLQKTSSRRLEDVLVETNIFVLAICLQDVFKSLQDVFKTSSRRLQGVFKASSRRLQGIFKTSCKDIFKTFPRRTIRLNCLPRSHLWEIYGQCRKFVSVLKFIKFYHNSMVLVFHFTGT